MDQNQKRSGVPPQVSAFLVVLALLGIVIGFAVLTDPPEGTDEVEDAGTVEAAEPVDPFAALPPDPQDPASGGGAKKKAFDPNRGISELALDAGWKSAIELAGAGRTAGKSAQRALDEGRTADARKFIEQAQDAYDRAVREGRAAESRFAGGDLKRVKSKLSAWAKERLALPSVD